MNRLELEKNILPLQEKLQKHPLYSALKSVNDISVFTEFHVFAVWDFMSILKSLQQELCCATVPWRPSSNNILTRFINEIVLAEESDINIEGTPKSHFEIYLDAMQEVKADLKAINEFLKSIDDGFSVKESAQKINLDSVVEEFISFTFEVIHRQKIHEIASIFTYGRENLIPDMFVSILKDARQDGGNHLFGHMEFYLQRHIDIDGDEHGPLALKMMDILCATDEVKWQEAKEVAVRALELRIALWDRITDYLNSAKEEAN